MASSRKSRSDPGILALVRALLQEVLGLSPDTTGKIMRIIRSSGQLQDMKQNMRSLNALAYRRLNHAIDIIVKDEKRADKYEDEHDTGKKKKDDKPQTAAQKRAEKKAAFVKESFVNYLLTELQLDTSQIQSDDDIRQDIIKLTRANPQQAASLEKRMTREKMQRDRRTIQGEQDPKRKAQMRQIVQREKQLQNLKDEMSGEKKPGGEGGM